MEYTNDDLNRRAKALSDSEKQSCVSTINVVKKLLELFGFELTIKKNFYDDVDDEMNYAFLLKKDKYSFTVLLQGSYGNGTGVRQESDVDISLICEDVWVGKYNKFLPKDYNFCNSSFSILDLKSRLTNFINSYYPTKAKEANKCIDFQGNGTSRKNVDIVLALRYRDYSNDLDCNPNNFVKGICIKTLDGKEIINYPEQTKDNSILKNKQTNYFYKKIVRIIKNIKLDMEKNGVIPSKVISSFGLESMLFNVQNNVIIGPYDNMKSRINSIINYLYSEKENIIQFMEPNKILKIFDNPKNKIEDYQYFIVSLRRYVQ